MVLELQHIIYHFKAYNFSISIIKKSGKIHNFVQVLWEQIACDEAGSLTALQWGGEAWTEYVYETVARSSVMENKIS